jgi:hypothetical protein
MKTPKEIFAYLKARWGGIDWCRCEGKGYWFEQINGPGNLRIVYCPFHWDGKKVEY